MDVYDRLTNDLHSYFSQRGWQIETCPDCDIARLYKNRYEPCPYCQPQDILVVKDFRDLKERKLHTDIATRWYTYVAKTEGAYLTNSMPIWQTFSTSSFVGAALEFLDGYRYRSQPLPQLPTILFQPSIRLRGGVKENELYVDPSNFLSPAFLNVSVLRLLPELSQFPVYLDRTITELSHLGIHASRVCLAIDPGLHEYPDTHVYAVRVFVDGLLLGDYAALISTSGLETIVEAGFGLERVATRCFLCEYADVFYSPHVQSDILLLRCMHALALITMSTIPFYKGTPWSKARTIAHLIEERFGQYDSFAVYSDMYNYWYPFVNRPSDKMSSFLVLHQLIQGGELP